MYFHIAHLSARESYLTPAEMGFEVKLTQIGLEPPTSGSAAQHTRLEQVSFTFNQTNLYQGFPQEVN